MSKIILNVYCLVFLITLCCFLNYHVSAQKISVTESTKEMSLGTVPAQCVSIYGVDDKTILKEYSRHLSRFKTNPEIRKGELMAINIRLNDFPNDTISIYANTESAGNDEIRLQLFIQKGTFWIKQQEAIVKYLREDLHSFAVEQCKRPVESNITKTEKNIDQKQKEISDVFKENGKLNEEAEECKKTIEHNNQKVSENESYILTLNKELEDIKKQLADLQEQLKNIK
jgi:chromosome segregation ATPase